MESTATQTEPTPSLSRSSTLSSLEKAAPSSLEKANPPEIIAFPQHPPPKNSYPIFYPIFFFNFCACILIFSILLAGHTSNFLPGFAVVSLDLRGLKEGAGVGVGAGVNLTGIDGFVGGDDVKEMMVWDLKEVHDVMEVYMTAKCEGFYDHGVLGGEVKDRVCHYSSSNIGVSFSPKETLERELESLYGMKNASAIMDTLSFPSEIALRLDSQSSFTASMHAVLSLYILSLIGCLLFMTFPLYWRHKNGPSDFVFSLYILLTVGILTVTFIASTVLHVTRNHYIAIVNEHGSDIGIQAFGSKRLLVLVWTAFGSVVLGAGVIVVLVGVELVLAVFRDCFPCFVELFQDAMHHFFGVDSVESSLVI